MAVELEGLEFQIEAKSEEGTKGIDALTTSLGKLKQATKGGLGLNSKVKELNKLNEALKGFHTDKLESLGKALASLNGLGKTQISSTSPCTKSAWLILNDWKIWERLCVICRKLGM